MKRVILAIGSFLFLSGCASSMRAPVPGILYNDSLAPVAVSSNPTGNRMGEACATSILGLYASGDASIEAARRNGGITMISSVDQVTENYFIFYAKYCTIVRGR